MANPNPVKKFVKNDSRINRRGRPRSFDKLRKLAQDIASEMVEIDDGSEQSRIEMILRKLTNDDPVRFIEIAFGKPTQHVDITANARLKVVPYDYNSAARAICADDDGVEDGKDGE